MALTWVSCGAIALTRAGERVAVRAAVGFRWPSPAQAAVIQPLWSAGLTLAAASADDVDLYVQRARKLNAFATGGRSVAVTSWVLDDHRAGHLSDDQVVAVLVHELGHHATGATRPMLFAMWLAARGAPQRDCSLILEAHSLVVRPDEASRSLACPALALPWCSGAPGALADWGSGRSCRALRGDLPIG